MNEHYSRRGFLLSAGAGAAGLAAGALEAEAAAAEKLPPIPIIDPHQHLWDLKRFHLPWLSGAPELNHSHVLSDYRKATEGLKIDKTVYMEVDLDPKQQQEEADYV